MIKYRTLGSSVMSSEATVPEYDCSLKSYMLGWSQNCVISGFKIASKIICF